MASFFVWGPRAGIMHRWEDSTLNGYPQIPTNPLNIELTPQIPTVLARISLDHALRKHFKGHVPRAGLSQALSSILQGMSQERACPKNEPVIA